MSWRPFALSRALRPFPRTFAIVSSAGDSMRIMPVFESR